jgi:2'-5' RNA ligase
LPFRPSCAIFDFKEPTDVCRAENLNRPDQNCAVSRPENRNTEGVWRMMLRIFIALEIPAGIQAAITNSTASLKNALPRTLVRWVAPQNVHLTLKFLGDVSSTAVEHLAETVKIEASSHEMFSISVGGLGAFPTARRARVIWIGLKTPPALETLRSGLEAAMTKMGYPPEERPFSPHLTIGRVRQNVSAEDLQSIRTSLEATKVGEFGTLLVETVHIFKSDLKPSGSVYTDLFALALKPIN